MSTQHEPDASTDRLLRAVLRPGQAPAGPACLDGERLAAWADGQIWGQEALDIEAHLADCARCQALMAAFARSQPADAGAADGVPGRTETPTPIEFRPRRTLRWFVPIAAGTAAASLLIWTAVRDRTDLAAPQSAVAKLDTAAPAIAPASRPDAADANRQVGEAAPARPPVSQPSAGAPPSAARSATEQSEATPARAPARPQAPPPSLISTPPTATLQAASTGVTGAVVSPPPVAAPTAAARGAGGAAAASDAARTDTKTTWPSQGIESIEVTFSSPAVDPRRPQGAGAGGGVAMRAAAQAVAQPVRWLVSASGRILRSATGGASWEPVTIDPTVSITGGVAPSASVCWLIGRSGVVLRSDDGFTFARVKFPEAVDLRAITAADDREATVTAADGRTFKTSDAGATWRRGGF